MKKRDHLSGWRSRYFVLDGKMLYYYTSQNKHEPKGSVYLTRVRRTVPCGTRGAALRNLLRLLQR